MRTRGISTPLIWAWRRLCCLWFGHRMTVVKNGGILYCLRCSQTAGTVLPFWAAEPKEKVG